MYDKAKAFLDDRDIRILAMDRAGRSWQEMAEALNVCRERARQLLRRAHLRQAALELSNRNTAGTVKSER